MATVRHVTSGSRIKTFKPACDLLNRGYGVLMQVFLRVFSRVWSIASSFNLKFPLVSSKSSDSYLRLLPCLPSILILSTTFPSITCFRRQFIRKIWPIHLAFRHFIVRKILFSFLTLCHNPPFPTRSVPLIFWYLLNDTFQNSTVFLIYFPKFPRFSSTQTMLQICHFTSFFLKFNSNLLMKSVLLLSCHPDFHCTTTSCAICYCAPQRV